jgi:lipid II:glycine glycyltransferase (peptidoglycan interpeptide bridge formation enzyme)
VDTIQPPRTLVVDLRPDEEQILQNMKQKTRYNVRLAERKDVTVRQGSAADISTFNGLMAMTGERDNFGVHEPRYYEAAYELFAPEQAALFLAEFERTPLAAIMVFAHGKRAAYFYGASSEEERQRMPSYAVQWAAMRWARARGCTEYDLWGVPDAEEETLETQFMERSEGLWGVYRFKRGFGGELKRTVGATDRVYSRLLYRLYQWRRGRQEGA